MIVCCWHEKNKIRLLALLLNLYHFASISEKREICSRSFAQVKYCICWVFVCVLTAIAGKKEGQWWKLAKNVPVCFIWTDNTTVFIWSILQSACSLSVQPWESIYFTHQLDTWHFNAMSLILMGFRNCIMVREKCFIQEKRHQSH